MISDVGARPAVPQVTPPDAFCTDVDPAAIGRASRPALKKEGTEGGGGWYPGSLETSSGTGPGKAFVNNTYILFFSPLHNTNLNFPTYVYDTNVLTTL